MLAATCLILTPTLCGTSEANCGTHYVAAQPAVGYSVGFMQGVQLRRGFFGWWKFRPTMVPAIQAAPMYQVQPPQQPQLQYRYVYPGQQQAVPQQMGTAIIRARY